ncbi:MAG: DUF2130 domain-containing protein [Bacilli bacterium]
MKLNKVTVVDKTTLRLEEDAKSGDTIDLNDLKTVDETFLNRLIVEGEDNVYKNKLDKEIEILSLQHSKALDELKNKYDADNKKIVSDKDIEIANLKKDISIIKERVGLEKENEFKDIINEQKEKIALLTQEKESSEKIFNSNLEAALSKANQVYQKEISEKETTINNLRNAKNALGIKPLGEALERTCNNKYEEYSMSGFQNCTWEKDNLVVKDEGDDRGTKADYIFRVFSDSSCTREIASVCCDMKAENPESKNKKTNDSHYKKLDKDRNDKKCIYALLISELERNTENDPPIIKVKEYKNMYMVRPEYFITFLSIVESLSRKYSEILLLKEKEDLSLKEKTDLEAEFEELKERYLNKPIEKLNKNILDILSSSDSIQKENAKISAICHTLIDITLTEMKDKIERFDIKKIGRKLDKIEGGN